MNDDEDRIRKEAHKLWEGEGRPEGRSERHWAEAREIIALKDSNQTTLKPLNETLDEPAEPAMAAENLGDLPGMTDQGDERLAPSLDAAREISDEPPLVTDHDQDKSAAKSKERSGSAKGKNKASSSKGEAADAAKSKRKSA